MTTTNTIKIIKSSTGKWSITVERQFTNRRLVRQGGAAYNDLDICTEYFPTRAKAVAFLAKMVDNGYSAHVSQTNGHIRLTRDDRAV
jgi:hypothetical protein